VVQKNKKGYFGEFGGQYVPDTLYNALSELETTYKSLKKNSDFKSQLKHLLTDYVGRPTPLFLAKNISTEIGAKVYLKREDLNHTGAHKINNTLGQILLATFMGKNRIIAETGAGQHGVATATVCALMKCKCTIYMGETDIKRQSLNVQRMKLLGAEVRSVKSGSKTLKDATTAAIRDWMKTVEDTHYIIGSALGPHPYPTLVRDFQKIIGEESKKQILKLENKLPTKILSCVGGGSNAIGMFYPFISNTSTQLIAVEAGGRGNTMGNHAAAINFGRPGVLHGAKSFLLQNPSGQISEVHSISAGLDYPGVSPELSHLAQIKRITPLVASDEDTMRACKWVAKQEGIIPALETAHAFVPIMNRRLSVSGKDIIIINVSGRGDKDMETIINYEQNIT